MHSRWEVTNKGSVSPWLSKVAPRWKIVDSGVMGVRGGLLNLGSTVKDSKTPFKIVPIHVFFKQETPRPP